MPVSPEPSGGDWIAGILALLGATPTVGNTQALALWARSEGMPPETFNWLAATDVRPGSRDYNSAGVQEYVSMTQGLEVLHAKFTGHIYPAIGATLIAGQAPAIYEAINSSPWCHGCQGGHYPLALYSWIESGQPGTGGPTPIGQQGGQQTGPKLDSWDGKVSWVGHHVGQSGLNLHGTARAIESLF
jgi:hypothetical protein